MFIFLPSFWKVRYLLGNRAGIVFISFKPSLSPGLVLSYTITHRPLATQSYSWTVDLLANKQLSHSFTFKISDMCTQYWILYRCGCTRYLRLEECIAYWDDDCMEVKKQVQRAPHRCKDCRGRRWSFYRNPNLFAWVDATLPVCSQRIRNWKSYSYCLRRWNRNKNYILWALEETLATKYELRITMILESNLFPIYFSPLIFIF